MNIGEYSIRTPVISWLLVVILVAGGLIAYQEMGKLEDPAFTIKSAKIITRYPGASATEVQEELTYRLEDAIQRMPQVKEIRMSVSRPGLSDIMIDFRDELRAPDLPNVFDELRRKVSDVAPQLPPGAMEPMIIDDFGDVYGVYMVLTGNEYSWRDLFDTAERLKERLVLIPGVRKVTIDREQREVVFVNVSRAQMAELGVDLNQIASVLASQNDVVDAGSVRVGDDYVRINPTGVFESVQAIGDVILISFDGTLIRLRDIATITREYEPVPDKLFYINGKPGITIGISMLAGQNVVEVGKRLEKQLDSLTGMIPLGMEFETVYNQPQAVEESVADFVTSVAQAVGIVIIVLLLFMGLKTGLIIGSVLLITVAGTLFIMYVAGIELQRISLGALVIALGMLVDNAIVVAEGMQVRIQKGVAAIDAAKEVINKTIWPLLGGTAIGILAFSAIGLSPDNTGEFAGSLFYVILISLSLSWVTAVSTTPLMCALLMRQPGSGGATEDAYAGAVFVVYRRALAWAVGHKAMTLGGAIALLGIALFGFGYVNGGFFPSSNTPLFFVDIYEPEGTDIRKTQEDALRVSDFLRQQPGVTQTTTVVGGPHQRFTLVYDAKELSSAYAQIIVRTETRDQIPAAREAVDGFMRAEMPWLDPIIKLMRLGPGRDAKIEVRFSGPDPEILRNLADEAKSIMRADEETRDVRDDWRSPVKVITPIFNEQLGRQLGISREQLGGALKYAFEGVAVGSFRDNTRILPIRGRAPEDERGGVENLQDVQVWSPVRGAASPIELLISGYETRFEHGIIRARDRILTITASCNPIGDLADPLFSRLRPQIEAIDLPEGYFLEWGGEHEDATNAQAGLAGSLPLGLLAMVITTILLFGTLRQPLIIWLTVPFAVIGITAGLLLTDGAFDFMSLLGALSLVGLLIKNAIVLIEEIDQQINEGAEKYDAVLDSSVSRMRPVVLAAATTILGLIPLLTDVFFVNMAITMMSGLLFASVLTLIVVPTLYATLFGIKRPG